MKKSTQLVVSLLAAFLMVIIAGGARSIHGHGDCDATTDYLAEGDALFAEGDYVEAASAFECAVHADPLNVQAYRGQMEANLFAGAYAAALRNITEILINVVPEHPDTITNLLDDYAESLNNHPDDLRLLTGYSFLLWHQYQGDAVMENIAHILELDPENAFGWLFRGSTHFFLGDPESGEVDFAMVLEQHPESADVQFIISDAYLYGAGDVENSLAAALAAQELGLDTPRLHAILGSAYFALGDAETALDYFGRHIDSATVQTIAGDPLEAGASVTIDILPGQTYLFPIEITDGETVTLTTTSEDGVDSIMVLMSTDNERITGNDDSDGFNAGFTWIAAEGGSYLLLLSTFEGAGTGEIVLTRS